VMNSTSGSRCPRSGMVVMGLLPQCVQYDN
jgi:hypothetical protein